ncbi:MAG: hypothetical protein OEV65_16665 [Aquincola sp.]|nr:hypothetical protein [Aquincola sp.]
MHRNRSVMKHSFSQVPRAEIPRSTFDRSHGHKTTFDAGWLIPVFVDEALPGDTFALNMTGFARLATPIFPIMDNMVMDSHFFAVPLRLVWDNWARMNGEQTDPGDSTDFLVPQIVSPVGGYAANSIFDYMGIPPGVAGISHSALFLRAANLIWNEWYRDQNLQDSLPVPRDDGPDDPSIYSIQRRGKRHDYFTSALPWPQKGEAVQIPLGTTARVVSNADTGGDIGVWSLQQDGFRSMDTDGAAGGKVRMTSTPNSVDASLHADLSTATAATINSLRQAFQIQKIFERDARGGTRLVEIIRAHFGVVSPDFRMQRPEFLGGGSSPVNVSPIPQTSGTAGTGAYTPTPQGNLAAMGTGLMLNHGFTMSFTEHCIILGFVSVRADLTYQQGLDRMWKRRSRFDFYWPALAHIGEQAVLQGEIFADGTVNDDIVFGYQERHAEYRYKHSKISGAFRSGHPQSLDAWHLSQEFATAPVLDAEFIVENPPVQRVIAVPSEPHFLFDSYFRMHCARPMPIYGVPGLIDHF